VRRVALDTFNFMTGLDLEHLADPLEVGRQFARLRPFRVKGGLTAIGAKGDGSYLFPREMVSEIDGCISPGVGSYSSFENELSKQTSMLTLMLDGSVEEPTMQVKNSIFIKKNLSVQMKSEGNDVTLDWCVETYFNNSKSLVLQMDIEGDEYPVFLGMKAEVLNRFSVVILELHDINRWKKRDVFNRFYSQAIDILLERFMPIHLHINPFSPSFRLMGMKLPSVVELTLIQKNSPLLTSEYATIPNSLDFDFLEENIAFDFDALEKKLILRSK